MLDMDMRLLEEAATFVRSNKRTPHLLRNERIKATEVVVIDEHGYKLGTMLTATAIRRAAEQGLDLVVINPRSFIPVCKIVDFKAMSAPRPGEIASLLIERLSTRLRECLEGRR